MQMLQLGVLGRLLGSDAYGLIGYAMVVVAFAQAFADFGLSNAIIHFQNATRHELSTLYWLNFLAGALVFAVVQAVAPLLGTLFGDPRVVSVVRLVAYVFLLLPLGQQFQVLYERDLRFRRLAAIETAAVGAGAATGILCALRGVGVDSLVWALLANTGLRAGLLMATGWRQWRPEWVFHPRACSRFLRFGAYQMAERGVNTLGRQLDKVVIGATMNTDLMGYYYLANRLVTLPYQVINPVFTRVAFPVFSRVQDDKDRLRKGFLEMISVVVVVMAPIYVGLAVLARPIVAIQLGAGYGPVIALIQILSILGFLYAVSNPLGSVILARGRSDVAFYLNVVRTGLFAVALWFGVRIGLKGAAWSLVLVVVCVMVPIGFRIRAWLMDMSVREYLRVLVAPVGVALAAGAVVFLVEKFAAGRMPALVGAHDVVQLVVGAGVGSGIFWLIGRRLCRAQINRAVMLLRR